MALPSSTAATMVEKLSSARIISEADLATAVPLPMAMPISAFFKAGASFTPSPVWREDVGRSYSGSPDRREPSVRRWRHHGGDVVKALQVLHYTALMCRLHAGEAPRGGAGLPLQVGGQLIKLSACEANDCTLLFLLLLCDDAHPATDRQGCPFVVTLNQKQDHLQPLSV